MQILKMQENISGKYLGFKMNVFELVAVISPSYDEKT